MFLLRGHCENAWSYGARPWVSTRPRPWVWPRPLTALLCPASGAAVVRDTAGGLAVPASGMAICSCPWLSSLRSAWGTAWAGATGPCEVGRRCCECNHC